MEELLAKMLRLASRYGVLSPQQLPARALAGNDLPPEGIERPLIMVGDTEVGGGGTLLLRSPYMWVEWTVTSQRADDQPLVQRIKTGPSSWELVWCPCGVEVKATIRRRWYPAVDPVMDITTGIITGGPDPAVVPPEALSAQYLPMVRPEQLHPVAQTYYWATSPGPGIIASDMPTLASASFHDLAYCPPLLRHVYARAEDAMTWQILLRDSVAGPDALLFGLGMWDRGEFDIGPWAFIRVSVPIGPTLNLYLHWS